MSILRRASAWTGRKLYDALSTYYESEPRPELLDGVQVRLLFKKHEPEGHRYDPHGLSLLPQPRREVYADLHGTLATVRDSFGGFSDSPEKRLSGRCMLVHPDEQSGRFMYTHELCTCFRNRMRWRHAADCPCTT